MQDLRTGIKIYEWPDGTVCVAYEEDTDFPRYIELKFIDSNGHASNAWVKPRVVPARGAFFNSVKPKHQRGLSIGLRSPKGDHHGKLWVFYNSNSVEVPIFVSHEEFSRAESFIKRAKRINNSIAPDMNRTISIETNSGPIHLLVGTGTSDKIAKDGVDFAYNVGLEKALKVHGVFIGTFEEWLKSEVELGAPVGISEEELELYDALWSNDYDEVKAFLEEVGSRAP